MNVIIIKNCLSVPGTQDRYSIILNNLKKETIREFIRFFHVRYRIHKYLSPWVIVVTARIPMKMIKHKDYVEHIICLRCWSKTLNEMKLNLHLGLLRTWTSFRERSFAIVLTSYVGEKSFTSQTTSLKTRLFFFSIFHRVWSIKI